jgi:hypothetical protein
MRQSIPGRLITHKTNPFRVIGEVRKTIRTKIRTEDPAIHAPLREEKVKQSHRFSVAKLQFIVIITMLKLWMILRK